VRKIGTSPALVAAPFESQGRVREGSLGQSPEPSQTSLLCAGDRPRLKYVKVLEQTSEVVLLKGPVLLGVQRRPHWEQLRVDAYQSIEATSGVESASDRIIQSLRSSIRVDQYDSNWHRSIIGHVVKRHVLGTPQNSVQPVSPVLVAQSGSDKCVAPVRVGERQTLLERGPVAVGPDDE